MIIALILIGSVVGLITGIVAFLMGSSLLMALGVYSFVGITCVLAGVLAVCIAECLREGSLAPFGRFGLTQLD